MNKCTCEKIKKEYEKSNKFGCYIGNIKCLYCHNQPERSKREDFYYICLEMTEKGVDFEKKCEMISKIDAQNWVNQVPHLRTFHEKIKDAVL